MTDIPNATPEQEEAKLYTQRELFQLFQQWQKDFKNEQERAYEETELPNDIREILEESPLHQLKENLKRYKKHVHKYYHK
jgi:L-lactate utilization protein LutC